MNKFFKAGVLFSIALASVIFVSCGSDGKDGGAGKGGTPGADCEPVLRADLTGFDMVCGDGNSVAFVKGGLVGEPGDVGPVGRDCNVKRNAAGDGWDFYCVNEDGTEDLVGQVVNGEDAESEDACRLEDEDETLSISCKDGSIFVLTLCNNQTYNGTTKFCSGDKLYTRCNGEKFQPQTGSTPVAGDQYCARNLVMEIDREKNSITGVTDDFFVDADTSKPFSDNWRVQKVGECFARRGGVDLFEAESCEGKNVNEDAITAASKMLQVGTTAFATFPAGMICEIDEYFDLVNKECVDAETCKTILVGENVCYTDETAVPLSQVYVRLCSVNDGNGDYGVFYYDPQTVKTCDESKYTIARAIECVDGASFSVELLVNSDGSTVQKKISCIKTVPPEACVAGSTYLDGLCHLNENMTKVGCPEGYAFGTLSGATNPDDLDPTEVDLLHEYCIAKFETSMCNGAVPNFTDGTCSLSDAEKKISIGSSGRYVDYYSNSATAVWSLTSASSVCPFGGSLEIPNTLNDPSDAKCTVAQSGDVTATSKLATCPSGTRMVLAALTDRQPIFPAERGKNTTFGTTPNIYTMQSGGASDTLIASSWAYYCVRDIDVCPSGSYKTSIKDGSSEAKVDYCVKNGEGNTLKDIVDDPTIVKTKADLDGTNICPEGLKIMYGLNNSASSSFTTATGGDVFVGYKPDGEHSTADTLHRNSVGYNIAGTTTNAFPSYDSKMILIGSYKANSILPLQICARRITDADCGTTEPALKLYEKNSVKTAANASLADTIIYAWHGKKGRVCLPSAPYPYVCPNGSGVASSTAGKPELVEGKPACVIAYEPAENSSKLDFCTTKDESYEYDSSNPGYCKLKTDEATCPSIPTTLALPSGEGVYKPHEMTFRGCAIKIEGVEDFCPLNDADNGISIAEENGSQYNPKTEKCEFQGFGLTRLPGCPKNTFANPNTGWCEK